MDVGTVLVCFGFLVIILIPLIYKVTQNIAKQDEETRYNRGIIRYIVSKKLPEIEKQIDNTTVILLYILSFFIPLAGFIVGAIYASKEEEHYKHVGKNCLLFSVINIVLGFIILVTLFA